MRGVIRRSVKIDIPSILVHLRARHTEAYAAEHRVPGAASHGDGGCCLGDGQSHPVDAGVARGRLGRALGRKRGVIGEVPLPVVKEDRRSGLRAAAEANVPGLVAAERGGVSAEELLARIATAHRSAPPPEVP